MKTATLFGLLTAIHLSDRTRIYQGISMLFSGEDETKVTVDGYAQCLMQPHGGSSAVIGCVADDLAFNGKPITRALTTGMLMAGADQEISGTLAQTTAPDVANMAGAIALDSIQAIGARNTITLTAPNGRKLWMNFDTTIKFDNKADSGMKFTVIKPGQPVSALSGIITSS